MIINLFTSYYKSDLYLRDLELRYCLLKNSLNENFNKIYLLNESREKYENNKSIINVPINTRPRYSDFINFINKNTDKNDINIISNTDIYFDNTISLLSKINMNNTCVSLTRWDIDDNWNEVFRNKVDSQDCWIFKGQIKEDLKNLSDFPLGIPGCDNSFVFNLFKSGYRTINPGLEIKSFHIHQSKIRTYTRENTIKRKYMYLDFCTIDEVIKDNKKHCYLERIIRK